MKANQLSREDGFLVKALFRLINKAETMGRNDLVKFNRAKLQKMISSAPFNTKLGFRKYGPVKYYPNGLACIPLGGYPDLSIVLDPYEAPAPLNPPVPKKFVDASPESYALSLYDIFGRSSLHMILQYYALNKNKIPKLPQYLQERHPISARAALDFFSACEADGWEDLDEKPVRDMAYTLLDNLLAWFVGYENLRIYTMTEAAFAYIKENMIKGCIVSGNKFSRSGFAQKVADLCTYETAPMPQYHGIRQLAKAETIESCRMIWQAYEKIEAATGPLRAVFDFIGFTTPSTPPKEVAQDV